MSDRLTMLVMVGIRTGAHTLRSQVGIGSGSDCLLGQLRRILDISDSDAGVKEEKLEGSVGGEGECGDEVEVLQSELKSRRAEPGGDLGERPACPGQIFGKTQRLATIHTSQTTDGQTVHMDGL